jgi:5-methylthioadenosine/S-adenosylhomocysteine deaminase
MTKLLISGCTIVTGDRFQTVIDRGYLVVEGRQIIEVDEGDPPPDHYDTTIDATGMLACPGLINAHTHLCMTFGRSLGSDRALLHWLSDAQVPLMRAFEPQDYAQSATLGAIENLKAGNTSICEIFFSPHYSDGADEIAIAHLERTGIRTFFFRCSNDESFFDGFIETRAEILRRSRQLIRQWHDRDRVRVGVGPLIPWGSSPEAFEDAVALSQDEGIEIHLHTAETPDYNELVRQRTGKSNVEMLADVGALGDRVMLNHCVHLSDRDIELIAETGSSVIHDPTSNMLLASGIAPIPQLQTAGIPLGLACDGPACNNRQDMFETMKQAALLQKVATRKPEALVAQQVLAMATRGNAKALGMADCLGSLQPGFLADIILVDTRVPHLTPAHDAIATLVYGATGSDVNTVIVDGRIVVRDRQVQTASEAEIVRTAGERAMQARKRAGL